MKKSLLITAALLMGTAGYSYANSQDVKPLTFAQMDVNGDSVLSKDEAQGRLLANFDKFDKDGNGTLSIDEFPTRMQNRNHKRPTFAELDSDANGSISADEFAAQKQDKKDGKHNKAMTFSEFDRDGNGSISEKEFTSQQQKHAPKPVKRLTFEELDTDNNGSISESEYSAAKKAAQHKPATFAEMDKNGDKVLDKTEVRGPLLADFDKFDSDKSGTLSADELPQAEK